MTDPVVTNFNDDFRNPLLHAAGDAGREVVTIGTTTYGRQPTRLDVHFSLAPGVCRSTFYAVLAAWTQGYVAADYADDSTDSTDSFGTSDER